MIITSIGIDFWHTKAVPRLNVPSLRCSDGPNGVRGTRFFNGKPAACFPCGTALASTWNTELLTKAGNLMGEEAKVKGAHIILGPTVNMQRSPLGGRGFESFSEDPVLAGHSAASIVKGIQETGVIATIKHFVANDQEHDRMAVNAIVTERALREIYLLPFQIAVRDAKPLSFMTAYNKLNGTHLSENRKILQDTLRNEWGWEGMVMSDWFGTYSTSESINAGLDLEMPGPSRWRGDLVSHAITAKKVTMKKLDERVREVLKLVNVAAKLDVPSNAPEGSADTPETAALLRKIATESIVLLKNEKNALPFKKEKTVAVIGPNAFMSAYCGGGSAQLLPYYSRTPLEGIQSKTSNIKTAIGCQAYAMLPFIASILDTPNGKAPLTFKAYLESPGTPDRKPFDTLELQSAYMFLTDYSHPALAGKHIWYSTTEGTLTPDKTQTYEFGLTVNGTAKLYIDDELIIDNETHQTAGESFFNSGTIEETGTMKLEAGKTYKISVDWASSSSSKLANAESMNLPSGGGLRIGAAAQIDTDEEIKAAVQLAKEVDQVVICAGLNSDFESEGFDRPNMDLPGAMNDLISAVAAANPSTVVCVQSGTPVSMPWRDSVAGIIQAWYGGNETGTAIADILYGDVNPSGKLSLTFPVRGEDNPAYTSFVSDKGRALYGEDVFIGYRWYEARKMAVTYPFGHGLSYTTFKISSLSIERTEKSIIISVTVANKGENDGAQVVQAYISQKSPSVTRPPKELKGFTKVVVGAGKQEVAKIEIERKYATSFWDEEFDMWCEEKGRYDVLVGGSSKEIECEGSFEVEKTSWWKGL